ncbi:hypothetical protein YTPLAS18_21710 [Nitrospira sp.]|nr:hypothetical protein YTPLAS18_21710 [Nitrospira sp.]
MIRMPHTSLTRAAILLALGVSILAYPGCRNPAQSTLPPSAMAPPGTPMPPLPKGDVYADETAVASDALIEPGDTLDVTVHRGAGEEKFSATVRDTGRITFNFVDVFVQGSTVAQAEQRIEEALTPYMRSPKALVALKKRGVKVKRVFVFGEVKKPGVYPMARNMTVLQALAVAENYTETALLEEIRVVRGDLNQPNIYTADVARIMTYGDWTRNLTLQENDIVFVPREHLGDASEAAKKLQPVIQAIVTPLYPTFAIPLFFPAAQLR